MRNSLVNIAATSILLAAAVTAPSSAQAGTRVGDPDPSKKGVEITDTQGAPGMSPEVRTRMKNQAILGKAVEEIKEVVPSASPGAGLGGVIIDPRRNAVQLYWHGKMPSALSDRIAAQRRDGTTIEVQSARYTRAELLREIKRLMTFSLGHGDRIATAAPDPDGSGLKLGMRVTSATAARDQARAVADQASVNVPLDVKPGVEVQFATRQNDSPPFWGGGQLLTPDDRECTTGFGVTGVATAETFILTAEHCGNGLFLTGNSVAMGSTAARSEEFDSQLISTSSGNIIWTGGSIVEDPEQSAHLITGTTPNEVGQLVCTSGAFSGTICNIEIDTIMGMQSVDGRLASGLIEAHQANNLAAAGHKDSGGPVYVPNESSEASARGIISMIASGRDFVRDCRGVPAGDDRICSNVIQFIDIHTAMSALDVRINTG